MSAEQPTTNTSETLLEEKQDNVSMEEKVNENDENEANGNLESQLPEHIRMMLNAAGPTVKAVLLKQDGTSMEIDYDTTPSKMEAAKILNAPPTIVGQYHELEVIVVRGRFSNDELEDAPKDTNTNSNSNSNSNSKNETDTPTETSRNNTNTNTQTETETETDRNEDKEKEEENKNVLKVGINKHALRWPFDEDQFYGDLMLYRVDENGNCVDFTLNEYNAFYANKSQDIKLKQDWEKQCNENPSLKEPFSWANMLADCIKDDNNDFDLNDIDENDDLNDDLNGDNNNDNDNEEEEEAELNDGISGIENMAENGMISINQLKMILEERIRSDFKKLHGKEPNKDDLAQMVEDNIDAIIQFEDESSNDENEYNPELDEMNEEDDDDDDEYEDDDSNVSNASNDDLNENDNLNLNDKDKEEEEDNDLNEINNNNNNNNKLDENDSERKDEIELQVEFDVNGVSAKNELVDDINHKKENMDDEKDVKGENKKDVVEKNKDCEKMEGNDENVDSVNAPLATN